MQDKRLTGEEFDQKLFRSLARIGSSMRGVGMPKIPSAGRRGVGGRVKPSRATRADWPSEAEIADMVDRNRDGFVGDGEPWMTRVRRRARATAQGNREQNPTTTRKPMNVRNAEQIVTTLPMSSRKKKPKRKPSNSANTESSAQLEALANVIKKFREKYPVRKKAAPSPEDVALVKKIVRYASKEKAEENIDYENVKPFFVLLMQENDAFKGQLKWILDDDEALQSLMTQTNFIEKHKQNYSQILKGLEFDTSPDANEILEDAIASALADSPIFKDLVERNGWPATTGLFTKLPDNLKTAGLPAEEELFKTGGLNNGAFNFMAFSAPLFKWWYGKESVDSRIPDDAVAALIERDDGDITDIATLNIVGVVRHEYGHFLENRALQSGTTGQKRAIRALKDWFSQKNAVRANAMAQAEQFALQELIRRGINPRDLLAGNAQIMDVLQEIYDGSKKAFPDLEILDWMSDYGRSNDREFLAELFAMATSSKPEVQNKIPATIRPVIEAWLDTKIF